LHIGCEIGLVLDISCREMNSLVRIVPNKNIETVVIFPVR